MRRAKPRVTVAVLASFAALLTACSQGPPASTGSANQQSTDKGMVKEPAASEMPPPFDDGPVKIALVRQSGAGDYFQQWGMGAKQQAKAIGFKMQVYDAQADNAKQATDMQTAMNSGVKGIIVDHGLAKTMAPLIDKAIKKGIPVVVYDVEVDNPKVVVTRQDDFAMARKVLEVMADDLGKGAPVGYVNILGIAPLDRRHKVWKEFREKYKWKQQFFVGKFTNAVATDNAQLVDAALKANPNVRGIFAPYDELAKGATSAVIGNQMADQVNVYGMDISTADIQIMTKEGSPWVATAATDPAAVGAAVVRAMALRLAEQLESNDITFPATLITQEFLRKHEIKNMVQLRDALPELAMTDVATADWIPVVDFWQGSG